MNIFDEIHYKYQSNNLLKLNISHISREHRKKIKWYRYFLKKYLPKDKHCKILDIPCGHGNILYFLRENGYKNFQGYDIDENRIKIVKELGLPGSIADAREIIKSEKNVDLIFTLDFIEHLEKHEAFIFLKNCFNALNKNGTLIIRTPVTDSILGPRDLYNDPTHKWAVNSQVLIQILRQIGFRENILKDERPVPYKLVNMFRLFLFYILKTITNIYYKALGFGPFKVWSSSVFLISKK